MQKIPMLSGPLVMVVHGPEIFDRGLANWLVECIDPARIIVAGVMARTAAEESGLPVEFAGKIPSEVVRSVEGPVFLANCGKTTESGKIFGSIIASRLADRGLVQLECADQVIYLWDSGDCKLAGMLSDMTGYGVKAVSSGEGDISSDIRKIRGCLPGEPVFVNGLVIGFATDTTVIIRSRDGILEPVSGIRIKQHGLEKLVRSGNFSPGSAWCKSGVVRRSPAAGAVRAPLPVETGKVLVIDHCGFDLYTCLGEGICGVLSIGDDTTAICGHICSHRGIPVFGIVDGDEDGIVCPGFAPGSVVVMVTCGRDDELGREIAKNAGHGPVEWDSWVRDQVAVIGGRGHIIVPYIGSGCHVPDW